MPYICKKLSKLRSSDLFAGLFWVISEPGSPDYIAKSVIFKILVVLAIFLHEITSNAIDIDKNRFRTNFSVVKTPIFCKRLNAYTKR